MDEVVLPVIEDLTETQRIHVKTLAVHLDVYGEDAMNHSAAKGALSCLTGSGIQPEIATGLAMTEVLRVRKADAELGL